MSVHEDFWKMPMRREWNETLRNFRKINGSQSLVNLNFKVLKVLVPVPGKESEAWNRNGDFISREIPSSSQVHRNVSCM